VSGLDRVTLVDLFTEALRKRRHTDYSDEGLALYLAELATLPGAADDDAVLDRLQDAEGQLRAELDVLRVRVACAEAVMREAGTELALDANWDVNLIAKDLLAAADILAMPAGLPALTTGSGS
jgi:hypothetical protein